MLLKFDLSILQPSSCDNRKIASENPGWMRNAINAGGTAASMQDRAGWKKWACSTVDVDLFESLSCYVGIPASNSGAATGWLQGAIRLESSLAELSSIPGVDPRRCLKGPLLPKGRG